MDALAHTTQVGNVCAAKQLPTRASLWLAPSVDATRIPQYLDAFAKLIHHESVSRGKEDTIAKQLRSKREVAYFRKRWAKMINNDPFYNQNLTLEHSDFRSAKQSRRQLSWTDFAIHKD